MVPFLAALIDETLVEMRDRVTVEWNGFESSFFVSRVSEKGTSPITVV